MNKEAKRFFENIFEGFRTERKEGDAVMRLLEDAKNDIRSIRENIDGIDDDAVLDMYIYRLKAAEAQYKHLLKMAKDSRQSKTG